MRDQPKGGITYVRVRVENRIIGKREEMMIGGGDLRPVAMRWCRHNCWRE